MSGHSAYRKKCDSLRNVNFRLKEGGDKVLEAESSMESGSPCIRETLMLCD